MEKREVIRAGILGVFGVLFGAFGAHALKDLLTAEQLSSFNTGVRYQLLHAIALLELSLLYTRSTVKSFQIASTLMFIGVILFSGSIYFLSIRDLVHMEWLRILGPITPLGGTFIIVGWIFVVLGGLKMNNN